MDRFTEFFNSPAVQKWLGFAASVGLIMLGQKYPDVRDLLDVTAGAVGIGPHAYHATPPPPRPPKDGGDA